MRDPTTYRGWLRNHYRSNWAGAKITHYSEYPPLVRKVSQRGEVHYE